jgi:hypothetical protein
MLNRFYAVASGQYNQDYHSDTLKAIGYEDIVFNHALLHSDVRTKDYSKTELERRKDPSIMVKRFFSVQVIDKLQGMYINISDFDQLKQLFPVTKVFFNHQKT